MEKSTQNNPNKNRLLIPRKKIEFPTLLASILLLFFGTVSACNRTDGPNVFSGSPILEGLGGGDPTDVSFTYYAFAGALFLRFEVGHTVEPIAPKVKGKILSFRVHPPLPEGLTLNEKTGIIQGTPSQWSALSLYRITGEGLHSSATVSISFSVAKEEHPESASFTQFRAQNSLPSKEGLIDPISGYVDQAGRTMTPVPFLTPRTTFPTNKWYTDLSFFAKNRGNILDQFRAATHPLTFGVRDDRTQVGTVLETEGIQIYGAKLPYLSVHVPNPKPSPMPGIAQDLYASSLTQDATRDLSFQIPDQYQADKVSRVISHADELVFNTRWNVESEKEDKSMEALLARGSPYATVRYDQLEIKILTGLPILSIKANDKPAQALSAAQNGTIFSGTRFKIILGSDSLASGSQNASLEPSYIEYILYASSPIELEYKLQNGSTLVSKTPFIGVLRAAYVQEVLKKDMPSVAAVEHPILEQTLDRYAHVYPTEAKVNPIYHPDLNQVDLHFIWKTETWDKDNPDQELLMTGFSETHLKNFTQVSPVVLRDFSYPSLRGNMIGLLGDHWVQTINLPLVSWHSPRVISSEKQTKIRQSLLIEQTQENLRLRNEAEKFVDSYGAGKYFAKVARLILIADELGEITIRDGLISNLKEKLTLWFQDHPEDSDGQSQGFFVYDKKFGGVLTARAASAKNATLNPKYSYDFSNAHYTDHHFHYGYFLYAAATVARFDSAWKNQFKNQVDCLARDIANPSRMDPDFTPYRHFDWFEGHANANGLEPGGSGRNQESSSEAVNAWYSLSLWGDASQNPIITYLGRLLTQMEIQAAQAWWQINPLEGPYMDFASKPLSFMNPMSEKLEMRQNAAAGIIWGAKTDHTTFFGVKRAYIIGIQTLPFTPISELLFAKYWTHPGGVRNPAILQAMDRLNEDLDTYLNPEEAHLQYMTNPAGGKNEARFLMAPTDAYHWLIYLHLLMAQDAAYEEETNFVGSIKEKISEINGAFATSPPILIDSDRPPAPLIDDDRLDEGTSFTNLYWWLGSRPIKSKFR